MSEYHKLPIAAKRAADIAAVREPAVRCPACDTQVQPDQLLTHQSERCSRERPAPSPRARWLKRLEAMNGWVARGIVRKQQDRYCERDVVLATAWTRHLGAL